MAEFYAIRGEALPSFTKLAANELPEPHRSLLTHDVDMTSTLENFYRSRIHVELLSRHTIKNEYGREVSLRLDCNQRRVEFGAIRIFLDHFPAAAREEVLRERTPLGRILTDFGVEFSSRPRMFFSLVSDAFINRALGLDGARTLYGRRNLLADPWNRTLAEIVEILPPA